MNPMLYFSVIRAFDFPVTDRGASLPFSQYQIIVLDDKRTRVLTTCPESHERGTAGTVGVARISPGWVHSFPLKKLITF